MRAAIRLKALVADGSALHNHSLRALAVPAISYRQNRRTYATADLSVTETPPETKVKTYGVGRIRRRGRPKRDVEEIVTGTEDGQQQPLSDEAAAFLSEYFPDGFSRESLPEAIPMFMRPMRRKVGRPPAARNPYKDEAEEVEEEEEEGMEDEMEEDMEEDIEGESTPAAKKRRVGRPKKRGRKAGGKNKTKDEIKPPRANGRPPLYGPRLPSPIQEQQMGQSVGITRAGELKKANGRPRRFGPELPSKTIIDDGVEKVVYFRPGRSKGFFCEDERVDKESRQTMQEIVKEARLQRRLELAFFHQRPDGTRVRRDVPLNLEQAERLERQEFDKPTGPKVIQYGPLTLTAKLYLDGQKLKMEREAAAAQDEWAYPIGEDGKPIIPGGPVKKRRGPPAAIKQKGWDGSSTHRLSDEKWLGVKPKKIREQSTELATLLEAGLSVPKGPFEKSLVLNEEKCKEIFERFDFSEYQGCDILDFNPGFGIFSKELNKAIKPGKHILLEPETEFHPFLKEICTDPSFQVLQDDLYNWKTFDHLVDTKIIQPKKVPREEGVNKTLLITGMLQKDVKGDRFMAQIFDAMAKQEWVFKYGRVKCLLWIDKDMISRYLPRSFGRRNRAAVMLEAFADVREVAHPPQTFTWADHRFFFRMDHYSQPGHQPNKQDVITGVKYAKQLTYITMPRKPSPVVIEQEGYWPPLPWAETTLVELTPKLPLPYLRGDVPDSEPWKFFNLLLTSSFLARHNTMREVLTKIGGGAEAMFDTEEELQKFPELGEKHGVHVSVEELVALAKAYEFWPWRVEDPFVGSELRLNRPGMLEEIEDGMMLQ